MNARRVAIAVCAVMATMVAPACAQEPVRLFAAGSLRAAMEDMIRAYSGAGGGAVAPAYGASGLLRERIEKGERAHVFASADTQHPERLAAAGLANPPVVFARNRLCALAAPGVEATSATVLDRMLDPAIRLGASTPKHDPSGDYTWQMFERAEKLRPGAYARLDAKALKLVGGPDSPQAPPDRTIYGMMIADGRAQLFVTYCTNAEQAVREVTGARRIDLPEPLAVGANYGLTVLRGAGDAAERFAAFVLSPDGRKVLARHGFSPGNE